MGIVFDGVQTKLERTVAVKVLTPHPDLTGVLSERFMLEARTLARLDHPNIITVHDFGQTDCKLSYIVMEKIHGHSLVEKMQGPRGDCRELVLIMAEVCDALGYAHSEDVIHRDVKPENILIDQHGRARIADFGLAKLEGASHAQRLTRTHQMLGTPMYMAPEQVHSASTVDSRADLYACGVMLYEILTGELPMRNPTPPSESGKSDREFDTIIMGLLEKDPDKRIGDARAVSAACRRWAAQENKPKARKSLFGRLFRN